LIVAHSSTTGFVAINTIHCREEYLDRFETLFQTRAKAIDRRPGFRSMEVLKPAAEGQPYLVVSHWDDEASFRAWVGSEEFHEGHKRAFEDLRLAKEQGHEAPMTSQMATYHVLTR